MKAKDFFEEKKPNMRELWNLSDIQKEMIYSLMEKYASLHTDDVSARLSSSLGEVEGNTYEVGIRQRREFLDKP